MAYSLKKAAVAGLAGTVAMTVLMTVAPKMGMPEMNIGAMLATRMGGVVALGWMAHFAIGTGLAVAYALFLASRLPGPGIIRGAIFSLLPWLAAQIIVMPMMGMGLFSGSMAMAGASLAGHLVYGATIGGVLGSTECDAAGSC